MEFIKNLPRSNMMNSINQKHITIIGFSMFFGWLLAVPFEGQVLYQLLNHAGVKSTNYAMLAIIAHFLGLFSCGFLIKRQLAAKATMITSTVVCIAGSLLFFLPHSFVWNVSLLSISFFSGLFVACWGYFYKQYSQPGQRLIIAVDVLILSNGIMMMINLIAVHISALMALLISIIALLGALLLTFRLEGSPAKRTNEDGIKKNNRYNNPVSIWPFLILGAFIVLITINSGLMYQVVTPAFSHFTLLTSYYWVVPYVLALLVIRNISAKTNLAYILYVALAMVGMSYILFMILEVSVASYLIINTLMLGAFGVFDIFWWSILGKFFEYYDNPIKVWGMGLSMNVLGIIIGRYVGRLVVSDGDYMIESVIALTVVLVVLLLLPILNNQLAKVFPNHVFLFHFASRIDSGIDNKEDKTILEINESDRLTDREIEIAELLVRGYTYKAISETLFISENTMKYHTKNIYQKLNVKSKMELIKMFTKNRI